MKTYLNLDTFTLRESSDELELPFVLYKEKRPTEVSKKDKDGKHLYYIHEVVELFEIPNCEIKYLKNENNLPVEMSDGEKLIKDSELELIARKQPKTRDQILNEVENLISPPIPPVDETDKTPEEIEVLKAERDALVLERETSLEPLLDILDSKGTSFILALDGMNWDRARKRLSKINQLPQNVIDAFEQVIPVT